MKNLLPVQKNQIYTILIEDLGHNGEGIGRVDGFTIFIEGAIPGDLIKARIIIVKKNYAMAKILEFIQKSEDRIQPLCPAAQQCGGCSLQNMDYNAQLHWKTERISESIKRIGKIEDVHIHDTIGMENPWHYRNKAQFPVRALNNRAVLGFYKKGTHDIVNIQGCAIQHKVNDQIIEIIEKYMENFSIAPYDETTGKGLIRHAVTKIGFNSGEIMVVIVTNGRELPHKTDLIQVLTDAVPGLKSIIQNINTKKGNVILGVQCKTIYGSDRIIDMIGNLKFQISALSFFQVNPIQTKVLYEKALEYAGLTGTETVFDIYCGIGTISLFLAQKAKKVMGIEVVAAAVADAKENAKINDIKNTEFFVGEAEKIVPRLYEQGIIADVVVVDPPRKGCDQKVLDTIIKMAPERIVYVSCNPATLARDLKYLDENGYKTMEIQPVDMFPHTPHVECVILMQRSGLKDKK